METKLYKQINENGLRQVIVNLNTLKALNFAGT